MGHVPPPPMARNAEQALAWYGQGWTRKLRGRRSRLRWRRRAAYSACLTLIKAREAALGKTTDPWRIEAPPKSQFPRPRMVEIGAGELGQSAR